MLYFKDPINCVNDLCHLSWLIQDNRRLLKALNSIASCSNGTLFTQLYRNGFTNCSLHFSLNEDEDQPIVYCPSAEKELISPCSCHNYGTDSDNKYLWLDCSSQGLDDSQADRVLNLFVSLHSAASRLRLLNLRGNRLTKIPKQVRLFPNLNRLNLGSNKIYSIASNDFNFINNSARGDMELWLNNNQLKTIEPGALTGTNIY